MSTDTSISELATAWASRLRKGELTEAEAAALEFWLLADPEHARAFSEACYVFAAVRGLTASQRADILAPTQEPPAEEHPDQKQFVRTQSRWRTYAVAASVVVATVLGVLWFAAAREGWIPRTYQTKTGETRIVQLPDGSQVHLNARTTLRWLGLLGERRTQLVAGEALFQVVHDSEHPFYVETDSTFVKVLGTRFDLNRRNDATILTVLEGKVAVSNSPGHTDKEWTRVVITGERFAFNRTEVVEEVRAVDASRAVRWLDFSLELDKEPLAAVIEELSRYTDQPIRLGDDALKSHRIVGTLQVRDIREALHDLEEIAPVVVHEDGAAFVLDVRVRTTR